MVLVMAQTKRSLFNLNFIFSKIVVLNFIAHMNYQFFKEINTTHQYPKYLAILADIDTLIAIKKSNIFNLRINHDLNNK